MKYIIASLSLYIISLHAMDVDTEPVSNKRKHENISTTDTTSSSASSMLAGTLILSADQKERCEWATAETCTFIHTMKQHIRSAYPSGICPSMPKVDKKYIYAIAEDVADNKKLLEQMQLKRIANEMALRLHGTSKAEFSGDEATQTKLLHQAQDDVAKLTKINDRLYRQCNEPAPKQPLKKQKR